MSQLTFTLPTARNYVGLQHLATPAKLRTSSLPTSVGAVVIDGKDGGVFLRDATDTTSAEDGGTYAGTIIRSTDYATHGVWKREGDIVSPHYFGAVADGLTNDAAAIQVAHDVAQNRSLSFRASGSFRIASNVYINTYYPSGALTNRPATMLEFRGKLIVDGCDGIVCIGNGLNLGVDKVVSKNDGGFLKLIDCGYPKVQFSDLIGRGSRRSGIIVAGCFNAIIHGNSIVGYYKNIELRKSNSSDNFKHPFSFQNNGYSPNNPDIRIGRLGGDFNTAATDSLSCEYGIYGSHVNGGRIEAETEYCIRTANSVGWYFDENCHSIHGIGGYFESNNKHHIECYGRDCLFEVNFSATNREISTEFVLLGQRSHLKRRSLIQSGNQFMNNTVPQGSINVLDSCEDSEVVTTPLDTVNPLNRAFAASDLTNSLFWKKYSPTQGSLYPTAFYEFDEILDRLGGSFATTLIANDTNLYQYSQSIDYPNSYPYAFAGVMVRGISGKTRIMLKVVPGAGATVKYIEAVVNGSTDWKAIQLPFETAKTSQIQLQISVMAKTISAQCQIANAYLTEFKDAPKLFKNFSVARPIAFGGRSGIDLFNNLNIYGRMRTYQNIIPDADILLKTIEYTTYILPKALTDRTITLPVIHTAGLEGTEVTFLRGSGSSSNWHIRAGSGNDFGSEAGHILLGATDVAITLVAHGTQWLIKAKR